MSTLPAPCVVKALGSQCFYGCFVKKVAIHPLWRLWPSLYLCLQCSVMPVEASPLPERQAMNENIPLNGFQIVSMPTIGKAVEISPNGGGCCLKLAAPLISNSQPVAKEDTPNSEKYLKEKLLHYLLVAASGFGIGVLLTLFGIRI